MGEFSTEQCSEYWKLPELWSAVSAFEDEIAKKVHHNLKSESDYPNILLHSAAKTIITMREIIILCGNGYPNGALSLARNIYEQFIICAFLCQHKYDTNFPTIVRNYHLSYDLKRNNALQYEAKYCTKDTVELSRLETEKNSLVASVAPYDTKKEYWWSGKNSLKGLVDCIIDNETDESFKVFLHQLYLFYQRACSSIHACALGNEALLGIDEELIGTDTRPQIAGHDFPLYYATNSFIGVIGVVAKEFKFDCNNLLVSLNALSKYYQKNN